MRSALAALACSLACACAFACAKGPNATTNPKGSAEATPLAGRDAGASADGTPPFGLPMPQVYPRFVWDAAAADAASRGEHGR